MDKDIREKDTIIIEFTQELLDEWLLIYFKQHPRAKKIPIETPGQPSLNKWVILPRISMNSLKQNYKDFGKYVIKHYGLEMLGISECTCKYINYSSSKTRQDVDNYSPKFIMDFLSAECCGTIVDDSYSCITELTISCEYHKGIKGARIEFHNCKYDKPLLFKTREVEIAKSEKRKSTMEAKKKAKK